MKRSNTIGNLPITILTVKQGLGPSTESRAPNNKNHRAKC